MARMDYEEHKSVMATCAGFRGVLMALMRRADPENLATLQLHWGDVWQELVARHGAPGGVIPGDPDFKMPTDKFIGGRNRPKLERLK